MRAVKNLILLVLILNVTTNLAFSSDSKISYLSGEFLAKTNISAMQIKGKINQASCVELKCEVNSESIDTGIELRNKHMREKIFKAQDGTYPNIVFTYQKINFAELSDTFDLPGDISIHGTTQKLIWTCTKENKSLKSFDVKCASKVSLTNQKIERPKYLGLNLQDEVEVWTKWHLEI